MNSRTRFYLAFVIAVACGVAAIAAASASTPILFAPLSLAMLLGVPMALGAVTALAFGVPMAFGAITVLAFGGPLRFAAPLAAPLAAMFAPWLVVATALAVGMGAEWQPLVWFVVILPPWLAAASVGGLVVSFVPDGKQRTAIAVLACALATVAGPLEARYPASDVPYTATAAVTIAAPANGSEEAVIVEGSFLAARALAVSAEPIR